MGKAHYWLRAEAISITLRYAQKFIITSQFRLNNNNLNNKNMKAKKYRYFDLELKDGQKITAKAPQAKITVSYAWNVMYHHAKVKKDDVTNIIGIE